jgi:hypothetical protein
LLNDHNQQNPDEEDSDAEDCAVDDSEDEELGEDDDTDVKEFPNPAVELFGAETASSGQEMVRCVRLVDCWHHQCAALRAPAAA